MAIRNKAAYKALYGNAGTVYPDNTIEDIAPADFRAEGEDIADSFYNKVDDAAGLARPAFADWDLSGNTMPVNADAIGSGAAGAILRGDEVYFTVAGTANGELRPAGSSAKALRNTPTLDTHWRYYA